MELLSTIISVILVIFVLSLLPGEAGRLGRNSFKVLDNTLKELNDNLEKKKK